MPKEFILSGYESLFQFIRLNKAIPEGVERVINEQPEHLDKFLTDIESGNIDSPFFDHEDFDLYITALRKQGRIKPNEFLTCYKYLLILMEFTNRQAVREGDECYKHDLNDVTVKIYPIFKDGVLTSVGKHYTSLTMQRFKEELKISISAKTFEEFIKQLPPIEQIVFQISFNSEKDNSLLKEASKLSPSKQYLIYGGKYRYLSASESIHQYLRSYLTKFRDGSSNEIMNSLHAFGRVGLETIFLLRLLGFHMICLYNKRVRDKLVSVHGIKKSLYTAYTHDDGHADWASLIADRKFILNNIYPVLKKENDEIKSFFPIPITGMNIIEAVLFRMQDFVIGSTLDYQYRDRYKSFYTHIFDSFYLVRPVNGYFFSNDNFYNIKNLSKITYIEPQNQKYLILYFIVAKIYYQYLANLNSNTSPDQQKEKDVWEKVFNEMKTISNIPIANKVKHAIEKIVAQYHTDSPMRKPDKPIQNITWSAWIDKLQKTNDSSAIWEWATTNRHEELLDLIIDHDLKFLHPIFPLTIEKHAALLKFVEAQANLNNPTVSLTNVGIFSKDMDIDKPPNFAPVI